MVRNFSDIKRETTSPILDTVDTVPQDKRNLVEALADGLVAMELLNRKGGTGLVESINNAEGALSAALMDAGVKPKEVQAVLEKLNQRMEKRAVRHEPLQTFTLGG